MHREIVSATLQGLLGVSGEAFGVVMDLRPSGPVLIGA